MTQHPPTPGEDRDDPDHEAAHQHEDSAQPAMEGYKRHEREELEEAVDAAEDAEREFDEAVDEEERDAQHPTDG